MMKSESVIVTIIFIRFVLKCGKSNSRNVLYVINHLVRKNWKSILVIKRIDKNIMHCWIKIEREIMKIS